MLVLKKASAPKRDLREAAAFRHPRGETTSHFQTIAVVKLTWMATTCVKFDLLSGNQIGG